MHQARTLLFAQLFVALAFAQAPGVSFAADHAKTSAPAEIGRAHV